MRFCRSPGFFLSLKFARNTHVFYALNFLTVSLNFWSVIKLELHSCLPVILFIIPQPKTRRLRGSKPVLNQTDFDLFSRTSSSSAFAYVFRCYVSFPRNRALMRDAEQRGDTEDWFSLAGVLLWLFYAEL
jgi:hypothetical protein